MKILPMITFCTFAPVGLMLTASPAQAQLGKKTSKQTIVDRVLQVLPEGLLMEGGRNPYLLTGHPGQKSAHDGMKVNCYAQPSGKTFKYTDTTGATRTVQIYRYLNARIGK